jgi:hypothetical protein
MLQIMPEFPQIVSTPLEVISDSDRDPTATPEALPERVVWESSENEAPKETKSSTPPTVVALMPPIPNVMFDPTSAISDVAPERDTPPPSAPEIAFPAMEVTSIKIETESLPAPIVKAITEPLEFAVPQRPIELVPTPVQTESVPSETALKRPALAMLNDLPSPPQVTPGPPAQIETPVRDLQVNVAKPEVQTPQTHQTLVQPPVQPEVTAARQLVQPQPIVIAPESSANIPAAVAASPHFTQNGSQEKQDFRNETGRAPILETHSIAPHVESVIPFQSHLMPMESPSPIAHVVELPPQLPLPVAHRVSIDIGEKDSRVVVTLHENRGDVSVKIHAANEVLGAELRSSVGTLVEAFHREQIPLANMDFTTGYTATSDDGQQHGNQPRQPFQNRARKFQLAAAPTDQVEISSINLNA